jgi:hypothetical protein
MWHASPAYRARNHHGRRQDFESGASFSQKGFLALAPRVCGDRRRERALRSPDFFMIISVTKIAGEGCFFRSHLSGSRGAQ